MKIIMSLHCREKLDEVWTHHKLRKIENNAALVLDLRKSKISAVESKILPGR